MRPGVACRGLRSLPIDSRTDNAQRKEAILAAATRAFARLGLRGSSLRDIARDAGVSHTLVDHHFGSKAMLLEAVVNAHRDVCLKKIAPLKNSLMHSPARLSLSRLVDEWTDYEFELYSTRQGRHDLDLTLRLEADADLAPGLREGINCSEAIVIDALRTVQPALDELDLTACWTLSSACVYAGIAASEALHEVANGHGWKVIREKTKGYVTRGLSMPASA